MYPKQCLLIGWHLHHSHDYKVGKTVYVVLLDSLFHIRCIGYSKTTWSSHIWVETAKISWMLVRIFVAPPFYQWKKFKNSLLSLRELWNALILLHACNCESYVPTNTISPLPRERERKERESIERQISLPKNLSFSLTLAASIPKSYKTVPSIRWQISFHPIVIRQRCTSVWPSDFWHFIDKSIFPIAFVLVRPEKKVLFHLHLCHIPYHSHANVSVNFNINSTLYLNNTVLNSQSFWKGNKHTKWVQNQRKSQ